MSKFGGGRIGEDHRKSFVQQLYVCDPIKNTNCKRHNCFLNGGPCRATTCPRYAEEENGRPKVYRMLRIEGRRPRT